MSYLQFQIFFFDQQIFRPIQSQTMQSILNLTKGQQGQISHSDHDCDDQDIQIERSITQTFGKLKMLTVNFQNDRLKKYEKLSKEIEIQPHFQKVRYDQKNFISLFTFHIEDFYLIKKIITKKEKSTVFKAVKKSNGKVRALKEIKVKKKEESKNKNNIFSYNDDQLQKILGLLPVFQHPNIPRVYEIFNFFKKVVISMQFLEGDLQKFMRKNKKLRIQQKQSQTYQNCIKKIFKQILLVLCYLHERKTAHLNISQKSIMLTSVKPKSQKDIIAKLVGFRKAKKDVQYLNPVQNSSKQPQQSHRNVFLAPEMQIQNSYGLKTDIWDLGLTLFVALTKFDIYNDTRVTVKSYKQIPKYLKNIWRQIEGQKNQQAFQLVLKMIQISYSKRLTAKQCLDHPWFVLFQFQDSDDNSIKSERNIKKFMNLKDQNNFNNLILNLALYKGLRQQDIQKYSDFFNSIDKDHNGRIQINQLISHAQKQNIFNTSNSSTISDACFDIMEKIDGDCSGQIDFLQFLHKICLKKQYFKKSLFLEVFQHFDKDKNYSISLDELKKIFKQCSFQELEEYMKNIDQNYDGKITQKQFVDYCMQKFVIEY